jgi:hypothetical protein
MLPTTPSAPPTNNLWAQPAEICTEWTTSTADQKRDGVFVRRFPRPVHHRIPNFVDAEKAAARLAALPEFAAAKVIKVNPDTPQKMVRHALSTPTLWDYCCCMHGGQLLQTTCKLSAGSGNGMV